MALRDILTCRTKCRLILHDSRNTFARLSEEDLHFHGRRRTLDVSMFILRGRHRALDGAVLRDVAACHSTLGPPHSTFHTFHFYIEKVHTTHSTLCTLHSTLHTLSTLYTLHSELYPLHCTLHTVHCTLYTLYTFHSTLHTLHFTLYTPHCTLHTSHSKLYTFYFKHRAKRYKSRDSLCFFNDLSGGCGAIWPDER